MNISGGEKLYKITKKQRREKIPLDKKGGRWYNNEAAREKGREKAEESGQARAAKSQGRKKFKKIKKRA